jgi:hypothetical protein
VIPYDRENFYKEKNEDMTRKDKKDLTFLREMQQRLNSDDPPDRQFVIEMVKDWIEELESKS